MVRGAAEKIKMKESLSLNCVAKRIRQKMTEQNSTFNGQFKNVKLNVP